MRVTVANRPTCTRWVPSRKRPPRDDSSLLPSPPPPSSPAWSPRLPGSRRGGRWCRRSRRTLAQFPWRRRIQELNHRRWFPPFDGTRFEFLVDSTGSIPLADLARKALAVHGFDIANRLGEIACPVLLLRTEGEGGIEAGLHARLERGLKGSRTEWLHSSGLHPSLTHPHRLAKLIKSFFPLETT